MDLVQLLNLQPLKYVYRFEMEYHVCIARKTKKKYFLLS